MHIGCINNTSGIVKKVLTGNPLRIAARLEPIVIPNEIWCTKDCVSKSDYRNTVQILEIPVVEKKGKTFNIKKKGSAEDNIFIEIYRVV